MLLHCTHAGNGLHRERCPLARRPTGKEKTKRNVVDVRNLMNIVEGVPCQLSFGVSRKEER
jgi:hypothetical protein